VVNGIGIAEEILLADAVGPHLPRSLGQVVAQYGAAIVTNVEAALDALGASAGKPYSRVSKAWST
jgi:hypothetical protein